MIYDLVCFALSAGILAAVVAINIRADVDYDDWTNKHTLFGCLILYGYLSMPFVLLTLPFVRNVLTHAYPTAYDEKGRCRQCAKPVSVVQKRADLENKLEKGALAQQEAVSDADAQGFLDKIKSLVIPTFETVE